MKFADICRQHIISQATFFNWKGKYSDMDDGQLKKMKSELVQYNGMYTE